MEYDEHEEDHDNQIGGPPQNYDSRPRTANSGGGVEGASSAAARKAAAGVTYRYRECLKNHAVNIGGHALDGCGDFMAAGDDGTLDALRCAACNCHRNFHRKEPEGGANSLPHPHHQQFSPYYHHHHHRTPPHTAAGYLHVTPQPRPLALPSASREDQEDVSNPSSSGGGGGGGGGGSGSRKRFRTKFSQEQKEKMLGFAERLGWRIQKHDDVAVEQFCAETGVRRQVLKVWMHNNKHTLGKKP